MLVFWHLSPHTPVHLQSASRTVWVYAQDGYRVYYYKEERAWYNEREEEHTVTAWRYPNNDEKAANKPISSIKRQ